MTEFDRILDGAFSRLEAGQSIDAILNRYPEYAEALEPLLETVSLSLHAYTYTEPASRAGMARGRQQFLSEAARRAEKRQARRRGRLSLAWLWPARRWAVAVAALLLFLAAGTTAVVASADSLPGSPLYPVKIAAEEVRLTLTRDPEPRARLHMERARRRTQELNALLTQAAPIGGDLLVSSLNEAEAALRELSRVPAELRSESLEAFAAFAEAQATTLDQARDRMTPAQQPLLESTADQYRRLADLARSAQTNPDALTPPPTTLPWPTSMATPTPASTRPRPTGKATGRAGPAAVTTRRPPARPTPAPTRRVRPTNATPTPAPTRRTPLQTPAVTPAGAGPAAATLSVRPTATGTPRLSVRPWTRTPSPTAVRRPTRTATRSPRPVATALATPRPHRPSPTPTATRWKPRPTPTPTRRWPTPTATPTHERDLTPTPTGLNSRPTSTQQPEPTSTPPAVATALPTAALPALPTPTPTTVAPAAPTAALPALPTSTPALAP